MTPDQVTIAWALIQVVQLSTWSVAFLSTLRAPPMERLPVLLGAVPAMYGTLVFAGFVETWVLGHPEPWTPRAAAWETLWQPWWELLALGAPVVIAMGLYALWLEPRSGWSMAARLAGMASAAAGIVALAALPA